jgi:hypothetical protein
VGRWRRLTEKAAVLTVVHGDGGGDVEDAEAARGRSACRCRSEGELPDVGLDGGNVAAALRAHRRRRFPLEPEKKGWRVYVEQRD